MNDPHLILYSAILVALLLLAAFFSCAETSLMAVNRYRLRHKAKMKDKTASRLLHLLRRPDRLLASILIGNTIASMFASSLATLLGYELFGDKGAFLGMLAVTFMVLIFCEITPKTLAAIYPERVARWVYYPTHIFLKVMRPLVLCATFLSNALLKLFRFPVKKQGLDSLSREELRTIVYDAAGKMPNQYQNMLLTILDLNTLTVDDVMVPEHDISGVNIDAPWQEIVTHIQKTTHDWVPFYQGTMNQVVGVLFARDAFRALMTYQKLDKTNLTDFIKPAYFVPEGTSLSVQLKHFQKSHEKLAFVVDEYGDVQGLVTLNDILEEIVGDFTKGLTHAKYIHEQTDGGYLVDGIVTIREFNRITGFELPLKGPRTFNGLIIEQLEALPRVGTTVLISFYPIEIIQVKENRVVQARVYPRLSEPHPATE